MGIILATLAICAFFLAQGATRVFAAKLLGNDGADEDGGRPVAVAPGKRSAADFERKRDVSIILKRNIFDSVRGDLTQEPVEETAFEESEEIDPNAPLPKCTGDLKLVGCVVNTSSPDWSFAAIVSTGGKSLLYRTGSLVDSSRIVAVQSKSVVMQPSGGAACQIAMFADEESATRPLGSSAIRKPPQASQSIADREQGRNAGLSDEDMEKGITKVSDTKFNVSRELLDKLMGEQASLMRAARVIPHQEDGRVVGVKLYGIRRTSLLGRLGIQNGDMMRTLNGFEMANPDSVLEAYTSLRSANDLTVALTRRGKPMNIEYNIQ